MRIVGAPPATLAMAQENVMHDLSSWDTETTGLDLRHKARPFLFTTCPQGHAPSFWEWDVDPVTRMPDVPSEDVRQIRRELKRSRRLAFHNSTFDMKGFSLVGIKIKHLWPKIIDTQLGGHLLNSGASHSLTNMVLMYLGIRVGKYEEALRKAVQKARNIARRKYPDWHIAKKDDPDIPSAKGKVWKFDLWLPRRIAQEENYPDDHPWWTVCSDYANVDTESTVMLAPVVEDLIKQRGLDLIFQERLKLLPINYQMEDTGITYSGVRATKLTRKFKKESKEAEKVCTRIAAKHDYDLQLPKSGNNHSLIGFVFGGDGLSLEPITRSKKTGEPSLDAKAIEEYKNTLEHGSNPQVFITNLGSKRKKDTSISYLKGYKRHRKKIRTGWYVLFPGLNPTGTATLRWSSSNPNEQNISKKDDNNLRYCFGPLPGREWYSLDAKNIELRIPAYESGEQLLIDLFEKPNEAPYYGSTHLLNFHTVYPELWDAEIGTVCEDPKCCGDKTVDFSLVGPHCKRKFAATWYQWCKNGGFAVQYGAVMKADGWGTADKAFHKRGSHKLLKSRFDKLSQLDAQCLAHARKYGYVETMPDKTVDPSRGYPLMCKRTERGGIKPTTPLNYHVQGTAMWWMCKAMTRVQAYLDELNEDVGYNEYRMIMQVHDELVFDFPKRSKKHNLPKIRRIKRIMEQGGDDIGIPTPVSIEHHPNNWSE